MHPLGNHLLIELYDCSASQLNDPQYIEQSLCEAANRAGATVVSSHANLFNPHGVSAVVIIAESHITIHTWPEFGYAALDVFTCGQRVDPWVVHAFMQSALGATRYCATQLERGLAQTPAREYRGEVQQDPA